MLLGGWKYTALKIVNVDPDHGGNTTGVGTGYCISAVVHPEGFTSAEIK
jgi:hypothetical protein